MIPGGYLELLVLVSCLEFIVPGWEGMLDVEAWRYGARGCYLSALMVFLCDFYAVGMTIYFLSST